MASAAVGTAVMVLIDVVISALIPDFRSRVQVAVLALLTLTASCAVGAYWLARWVGTRLQAAAGDRVITDGTAIGLPDGKLRGPEIGELLSRPEAADWIAVVMGIVVAMGPCRPF